MSFTPDYTQIEAVLSNRRPDRLPMYEHHIDAPFIEKVRGSQLVIHGDAPGDYENLAVLQYTDPQLFADLYVRIGDLYVELWTEMTRRYGDIFVFFRMGDDLGFKTSTLLEPDTIRQHILPQYKRVIDVVHRSGKKFLLHSCGKIFDVMEDIISIGIDAKHSNWMKLHLLRSGL